MLHSSLVAATLLAGSAPAVEASVDNHVLQRESRLQDVRIRKRDLRLNALSRDEYRDDELQSRRRREKRRIESEHDDE